MLTRGENDRLTRVGPGTPAGELLRRYWFPVATARELSEQNPTSFVRILGEDLGWFRDKRKRTITDTTRGLTDDVERFEFYEFPHGIMKKRI